MPRGPRRWSRFALAGLVAVASGVLAFALLSALLEGDRAGAPDRPRPGAPGGVDEGPADGAEAVVWAVGDGPDGGEAAAAGAGRVAARRRDPLLYLGDVYQRGTLEDFERDFDDVYGPVARKTSPTPGNHEWPNQEDGYDVYWAGVQGREPPDFYSLRVGGWQILSLNSEDGVEEDSDQLAWLRSQVQGPGTCRLAFWHRPRYNAGAEHGDNAAMQPFWDALEGRASLIVNGHEHSMQRMEPRDGITELISGAGGHSHYELGDGYPGLAFGNDTDYGALRLELRPGGADFSFIAVDGRTLDAGRVPCRTG